MIHSARPTVSPVVNIVLQWTDGRTTRAKTMIITGLDCGLAEWIKKNAFSFLAKKTFFPYIPLHHSGFSPSGYFAKDYITKSLYSEHVFICHLTFSFV